MGRKVRRQHIWKFNQHPADDDADPASPWRYVNLQPLETDTTIKTTREMLGGGIDSGLPCVCGEMNKWVQTVSAIRMLEQAGFNIRSKAHQGMLAKAAVAILVCPKCERVTQAPLEMAQRMRSAFESRRG